MTDEREHARRTGRVGRTRSRLPAFALAFLLAVGATPLAAQQPEGGEDAVTLRGVVLDEVSGGPVVGAAIGIEGVRAIRVTDRDGRFQFPEVPTGQLHLAVQQLGYAELHVHLDVAHDPDPLEIHLQPDPVVLEGITVMTDRLQSRRNALGVTVRTYDDERLMSSAAWDVYDFLRTHSALHVVPCSGRMSATQCVHARGQLTAPEVYIDETRAIGGLDQLGMYRLHEMHLIEVIAGGRQIRAYTHHFMERLARSPQALLPIFVR